MTPRQQPAQQAPPVQRLRLRYAKTGRARFASHRDFSRAFERALRRAGVPMAYSSGFSPHPRISFANASPTGAATDAEYLEIGLAEHRDPQRLQAALNDALPDGLAILAVVEGEGDSLAERLTDSMWEIRLADVPDPVLDQAVTRLLETESLPVQRMTKSGLRDFDARAAVIKLRRVAPGLLQLVSRHGVPLVRPDDVVGALARVSEDFPAAPAALFHRRAQGRWDGVVLIDPFTGEGIAL